jgi:choice-of-anchor B domain-containing protein
VNGDRVYVGLLGFGSAAGAVHAFTRDAQGTFRAAGQHFASEQHPGENFGGAVAAEGSHLWIAAPRANTGRGIVYQIGADSTKLTAANAGAMDLFGGALAARGNLLAISAFNDDFGLGSVAIYELANGKWTQAASLARPDERMASQTGKKVECSNGKAQEFPCSGVDLLSFMSVADIGGTRGVGLSGIWGWTDPDTNREYALVGRMDGTAFVDVTDPSRPRYLGDLLLTPGANPSYWREIKTYKNYMLVSSDGAGAHGLQIFDLKQLRDVKAPKAFTPTALYRRVNSVHNVVVNEESGFAYAVGSSSGGETCGGGLHMIDMKDPLNPQFAGCFADPQTGRASTGYTHDALCVVYHGPDKDYQNREICLGANETMLSIADVTDKKNPKAVSRAAYPKVGYLHQGWFTKDMRYFFMNDELDEVSGLVENTRTLIWDLADLDDPQMVKEFSSPGKASDHNLYIMGDLMYQSHYKAGVRLVDVSNPLAPVEIGYFDTAPSQPDLPGFAGSWGNFPYFKSGTWIASSVDEGLFVLKKKDTTKPVL